jgi:molybdopterin/thiamine biosynthesis adenylyltransferase
LAFSAGGLRALRNALLGETPLEMARFLLARPVRTSSNAWRLVVYDAVELAAEDYVRRSEVAIELPPAVVAKVMQRARTERATIVLTHSHPFPGTVAPSAHDLAGEALILPAFRRRVPGVPHARLIVGPHALHAALFEVGGGESPLHLMEVGPDVALLSGVEARSHGAGLEGSEAERYDRQVRAFGTDGQRQLAALRVVVVGVGGTGSIVAQQLAHLGVGNLLIIDPDTVEETNLNRVVGARPADVGRPKVDVSRDMVVGIHPEAKVEALRADVRDRSIARRVLDADVFFLCTDSHGSRAVLAQVAYQYLLPGFDVGVAIYAGAGGITHVSGRVQMLAPGLPCLLCCGVLDSEAVRRDLLTEEARAADRYIIGAPTPQPAVVSINGAASSLAVTMFLSAITGVPYGARNQRLRLESGIVSRIEATPRADCPVCSPRGALARGDSWPMPGRPG